MIKKIDFFPTGTKLAVLVAVLIPVLAVVFVLGLAAGPSGFNIRELAAYVKGHQDPLFTAVLWRLRFPRVVTAAIAGGVLSLGGLVFQAILRNPLAEPFILGISGGSALGAVMGITAGLSRFPGVSLSAFAGSMASLGAVIALSSGRNGLKRDSVILAGVMINAFSSALIMFLISLTQDTQLHSIMFWLMGDLSSTDRGQAMILVWVAAPCFFIVFMLSNRMNLMLLGHDKALSLGLSVKTVTLVLLITASLMVSVTVSQCGLLGFVGLVIPHVFRLILGPDHRVLVFACILGGASCLTACDMIARCVPAQGELPVGVVTAMIGAPVFITLLRKKTG